MTKTRSFADAVRQLDADGLATLLRARPDLASPPPVDLPELIERASSAPGAQRAMDGLDAWRLRVLVAVAALDPPVTVALVAEITDADPEAVGDAVGDLCGQGLVWVDDDRIHPIVAVRTVLGRYPAGLAPRSAAPMSDAEIDSRLAGLDARERAVVDKLTWGPPTGQVKNATRAVSEDLASTPVERLLAAGLLRPIDDDTVVLPREVSLRLRQGRYFRTPVAPEPVGWPDAAGNPARAVSDMAGLGSAAEFVQHVAAVCEALSEHEPKALARGGIGQRDLHSLGVITGDVGLAGFVLELAHSAGLVAESAGAWLPTRGYDRWLELGGWERWTTLRDAYPTLASWPSDKSHVLDDANATGWAAGLRTSVVGELAGALAGTPIEEATLAARLAWLHPTWGPLDIPTLAKQLVLEASWLGLVALGRRTSLPDATSDPGFPAPVDQLIIESDLSAIAPGPLRHDVARTMAVLAKPESHGGGTVYRFTRASIRAGMDAGWNAEQILDWVGAHTATDVPQPLRYLVTDVARDYGRVEVAAVSSLLTLADAGQVVALLRHPDAAALGLREVAPGVLVALAEPDELVRFLQSVGLAPLARTSTGERWVTPPARRAPTPARRPALAAPDVETLAARLLAGPTPTPTERTAATLDVLRAAQEGGTWVVVEYVDADGATQRVRARVLALGQGGTRIVPKASAPITLQLSRVVAAEPAILGER